MFKTPEKILRCLFFAFVRTVPLPKKDDTYVSRHAKDDLIHIPFLLLLQVRVSFSLTISNDSRQ